MIFPINKKKSWTRLLIAISYIVLMQFGAAHAQKITLSEKNAPMELIFNEIRLQSGYDFIFNQDLLKQAKPVTVHLTDKSLQEALDVCFLNQPFTYIFQQKTIVVQEIKNKQISKPLAVLKVTVRGRVIDNGEKPLQGSTIKVADKNLSAVSAKDGSFFLRGINVDAELEISFVGYITKRVKAEADLGDINLQPIVSNLDLVNIIAYGTTSKRFSVGSIVAVEAKEIEREPVTNVLSALQGRVPGLLISPLTGVTGGDYAVHLRGSNSLVGSNDPLYVIDGIPYTSVSVSKIAGNSSAAGSSNPLNDINPYDIESVTVLKDASSTSIYGARGANGVIVITMKKATAGQTKADLNVYRGFGENIKRKKMMHIADYLEMRRETFKNSPSSLFKPSDAPELVLWDQTLDRDWQEELLGTSAVYTDVQGSVSGGKDLNTFLLGGGYHKETTVFRKADANEKSSVHFSSTHQSTDHKFRAMLGVSYIKSFLSLPRRDITLFAASLPPNQPGFIQNESYNTYQSGRNNVVANATIAYQILPGLELKNNVGFNSITSDEIQINPSLTNIYSSGSLNSYVLTANNSNYVWNMEPQLNFNKIQGRGSLNMLIGGTVQSDSTKGVSSYFKGFLNDMQLTNLAAASSMTILDMNATKTRFSSVFSRIGYAWDEKYILDLSARRDGSSRFGPGKQFGNFGAMGIAWVFSNEGFVAKAFPFIKFGKFRASYGTVGNIPVSDYQYFSRWSLSGSQYDGIPGLQLQNPANEDLAWEVTKKLEFGLDLELFKGRTSLNLDYYNNLSTNQLIYYPLPMMTGFPSVYDNLGAVVKNYGLEFSIQNTNIQNHRFKWTTSLNFSAPRNKLLKFPNLESSTYYLRLRIGQPVYSTNLYDFVDIDPQTGLARYATPTGLVNQPENTIENRTVLFDSRPKYFGGIGNNLRYNGFELDVFFLFAIQHAIDYQGTLGGTSSVNLPIRYLDRWRKPGDISNNQLLTYYWNANEAEWKLPESDRDLVDASYIKLKNVSFSYSFSSNLLKAIHLKRCRAYFQGQNLLTITNFTGLDPETGNNALPPLRVLTFGFQFTL